MIAKKMMIKSQQGCVNVEKLENLMEKTRHLKPKTINNLD
jgi:hypothetical protein